MVVSQNTHATEIGYEILKKGGNAVDASVAVGFALAVTLPRAGNLGGGGRLRLDSLPLVKLPQEQIQLLLKHQLHFLLSLEFHTLSPWHVYSVIQP